MLKFTLPAVHVRCIGIRASLSQRMLDLILIVLLLLGVFPVVAAWNLAHPHGVVERGSERAGQAFRDGLAALRTPRRTAAPISAVCPDIAEGLDHLSAELSVAYYAPRSEQELSNLHYLTDITANPGFSEQTSSLATAGVGMLRNFFRMMQEEPQSLYVRKPLFLTNWNSLIRDLKASLGRDCAKAGARQPEPAPRTGR